MRSRITSTPKWKLFKGVHGLSFVFKLKGQSSSECPKLSGIALVFLWFALWLVQKFLTNQMQSKTITTRRPTFSRAFEQFACFPALWAVFLFSRALSSLIVLLWILIGFFGYFPFLWLAVLITWFWFCDTQSKSALSVGMIPWRIYFDLGPGLKDERSSEALRPVVSVLNIELKNVR